MQNITKALYPKIPATSFVLSLFIAWHLVPIKDSFPMVPFIILFIFLSSLVYLVRRDRNWIDLVLYLGIMALSFFLLIRANGVIQLVNFIFIILLGSILVLPPSSGHALANLILTPFFMIAEALKGKNIFPYSFDFLKKYNNARLYKNNFLSILITILFLGITIPLLSSANPFFNQLTQDALKFLNLEGLARYFRMDQIMLNVVRLGILLFLCYVIPRVLTASARGVKINEAGLSLPINYLIPKVAMSIVLVIFFVTQAQLYFATPDVLQGMGYTNSRITNEVFFQVTIVAFIIFFLVYLDGQRKMWNKTLTYILILEAFFLVGIAFKSVFDYSYLWGFTQKRLWGYATMTWLTGALIAFLYFYYKQTSVLLFFRLVIVYTVIVLIGINIVNFDYLISHVSKPRTISGTDYEYLAKLSTDGIYLKESIDNLMIKFEKTDDAYVIPYELFDTLRHVDYLKKKYNNNFPLNSYNFSEYNEYSRVKDVDTGAYRNRIQIIQQRNLDRKKATSSK